MSTEVAARVRAFIRSNFWFGDDSADFSDTQSLLDAGLIDSTGILELVGFIESEFHISVADADIVPENLDSISSIADYITHKQAAAAEAA